MANTQKKTRTRTTKPRKFKCTTPKPVSAMPVGTGPAPDPEGKEAGTMFYTEDDGWVEIAPSPTARILVYDPAASPGPVIFWCAPNALPAGVAADLFTAMISGMDETQKQNLAATLGSVLSYAFANASTTDLSYVAQQISPYIP